MRKSSKYYFQHYSGSIRFLLMLLLLFSALQLQAQSFDYETHPKLDFDFTSLELDLGIQPQNLRIDGAAHYQLRANVSDADTVILYAAHLDISSASINDTDADYMLHNDSLFIPLETPAQAGDSLKLDIRYSGRTTFGLLKDSNETIWTSLLPKAQRHWVPIIDNPQVALKVKFNISVPSGFQVWASGKKTSEEAASLNAVTYHFETRDNVPASSLAFTIGKFNHSSTTADGKQINIITERGVKDSIDVQGIGQTAAGYITQLKDSLQVDYPSDHLDVIVLPDHNWETKSWAASTVFLYHNQGDLKTQLLRGIIGQWFGVYQREANWQQSDAISLYQAVVGSAITDSLIALKTEDVPDTSINTLYNGFGAGHWNQWQQRWRNWDNKAIKSVIGAALKQVLTLFSVVEWRDYADLWYRQSGQPLYDMTMPMADTSVDSVPTDSQVPSDSVAYKVTYKLNEADGKLVLNFSATSGVYTELTSIKAYEIYPGKTDTSEVTFTGRQDSVMLQVEPMISTLRLEALNHPSLYLDEYKPASFLIYELRNDSSVDDRAEAASKLGYHADNPDLQLAIRDFMNKELDPKVKAGLISSLGDITQGAEGTEQVFLDALKNENKEIRDAALMALQHYKNNPAIFSHVESMAVNAKNEGQFRKATKVLLSIASEDQFADYAEQISQQDSSGARSIFVIQQMANMGRVEGAVTKANLFTDSQFSYAIRSTALGILIQHDHTPEDWLNRAKQLLDDADPRIRYLAVEGLEHNLDQDIRDYVSAHMQDEYDARVYQKMNELLSK